VVALVFVTEARSYKVALVTKGDPFPAMVP
jgi:hypothetical protein